MRLIDVDALMVVLEKIPAVGFKNIDNQTYTLVLLAQVLNIIKQQPTIEERKKGKWIIQDNPGTGWYRVKCSECDENVTSNIPMIGFSPHCKPLWDYCPYCGADMGGKQNDSISD